MKKTSLIESLALALCILLSSCAGMEEAYRADVCNKDRAYERGMNDGQARKPMNSAFSSSCDEGARADINKSYRDGYTAAIAARSGGAKTTTDSAGGAKNIINVSIGNRGIGIGGAPGGQPQARERAWFCEVQAFTKNYTAFGPTELEARQNVLNACKAKHHEMHCDDIQCRPNE